VCCVLFERGVLFGVIRLISVLCLIVVPLPLGKDPFGVKINNNNKTNICDDTLSHIIALNKGR
jgi:hypothetical protein